MINFPFETNGKLMVLGVPILKHFRVNRNLSKLVATLFSEERHGHLLEQVSLLEFTR